MAHFEFVVAEVVGRFVVVVVAVVVVLPVV